MRKIEKKMQKKPVKSVFTDRKKEAKFWEKNFETIWSKSKPVKVAFAKNLSESINVRLDPDVLLQVRNTAKEKGLGPTQLIRTWIMEKVRNGRSLSSRM